MAVTITRANLAARIRLGRTPTELDETDELLAYATEAVTHHAPDVVHNEAVYRLAGYIYDRPLASADTKIFQRPAEQRGRERVVALQDAQRGNSRRHRLFTRDRSGQTLSPGLRLSAASSLLPTAMVAPRTYRYRQASAG